MENSVNLNKDRIKKIFIRVKPLFLDKLGKYTHKKVTDDWYYHSLAFTHPRLGYVFGLNIGFFKHGGNVYNHFGMNVTVRNGDYETARDNYVAFFRQHLKDWITHHEIPYEHPERGGGGIIFPKYKLISDVQNDEDMVAFFEECIKDIHKIYEKVVETPDTFKGVVRAAPFWEESLLELCEERIGT